MLLLGLHLSVADSDIWICIRNPTDFAEKSAVTSLPKADYVGQFGQIPIRTYTAPIVSGLKNIIIEKVLDVEPIEQLHKSSLTNLLWSCGTWLSVNFNPSWNGYMELVTSSKQDFEVSNVVILPFIRLQPSYPNGIHSALSFAAEECKKISKKFCFVTFDQPLYHKA